MSAVVWFKGLDEGLGMDAMRVIKTMPNIGDRIAVRKQSGETEIWRITRSLGPVNPDEFEAERE